MKLSCFVISVIAALAMSAVFSKPVWALTATFPIGSGTTITQTTGGVTVTFSTTGNFFQHDQFGVTVDRSIRNEGFANYQLNFSSPINNLSLDIGGLDTFWGDVVHSFLADGNPINATIGPSTNTSRGFTLNMAVWNGSQLLPGFEQDNGARMFFGPTVISSLTFKSSGASSGSSHWIYYDNVSFDVVPEPSALLLLALFSVATLLHRRRCVPDYRV